MPQANLSPRQKKITYSSRTAVSENLFSPAERGDYGADRENDQN